MLKVATQVPGSRFRFRSVAAFRGTERRSGGARPLPNTPIRDRAGDDRDRAGDDGDRRSRTLATAAAVALATACVTLVCSAAWAAAFDPHGIDWEGLSQFVDIAEHEVGRGRVVSTATLDVGQLEATDAVFIVHPTRAIDAEELSAFMRAGGRVVVLDDYGSGDGFLRQFGIRRVPLPVHPAEMLRGNPALAIAEPAAEHPVVRSVTRVVTNHATGLEHSGLSPVLVVRGSEEPDVLLALAGSVGHGRLLAVGDASVVINAMLRFPGNRALAAGLVRYATEDAPTARHGGKIYLLTNDFDTTGTFGHVSPAVSAAAALRRALAGGVEELRQNGAPPPVLYLAAAATGLGVVVWTALRGARMHKPLEPRFVRAVPVAAQGGVAGHAAVLAAPGGSRVLAMLELKSALEEQLAVRLGLDRAPAREQIVAKVRAAGLLAEDDADALASLLAKFARVEQPAAAARGEARSSLRDREVNAAAGEVSRLLAAVDAARRGTVVKP